MKEAIVGIIVVVLIIAAAASMLLPKEQVIIDTTAFVSESREYSKELEGGQVIHVDLEVVSGEPVTFTIWNDDTGQTLKEMDSVTKTSFDLSIPSDGTHIFEIVNWGDTAARVRIKVAIKS